MCAAEHSWVGYQAFLDRAHATEGPYWRAGTWAIAELRTHLGEDWPQRAAPERHPLALALGQLPAMPVALAESVEWAARLRLVAAAEGRADLERDLKRDVSAARGLHTKLMLEMGGLALRLGWDVQLEPGAANRPADLSIGTPRGELSAEARVLTEDERSRREREAIDRTADHLMLAGVRHGVWVGGSYTPLTEDDAATVEEWVEQMAPAVHHGARPSIAIRGSDLTLEPRARPSIGLRSSAITGDLWPRMQGAIVDKASKMSRSGARWLRITLVTGIWRNTAWGRSEPSAKLNALRSALRGTVAGNSIDGIVLSSAAGHFPGDVPEQRATTTSGIAIRRAVAPLRARETLILPFSSRGEAEAEAWATLADAERDWLDWALELNGLPPMATLTAIDTAH